MDQMTITEQIKFKVSWSGVIFMQSYPQPNSVKIKWQNIPLADLLNRSLDELQGLNLHEHVGYHFKTNGVNY